MINFQPWVNPLGNDCKLCYTTVLMVSLVEFRTHLIFFCSPTANIISPAARRFSQKMDTSGATRNTSKRSGEDNVRRRKTNEFSKATKNEETRKTNVIENSDRKTTKMPKYGYGSYWLTRIFMLRYLGFIYCKLTNEIIHQYHVPTFHSRIRIKHSELFVDT